MHCCPSSSTSPPRPLPLQIALLLLEGRIPSPSSPKGFIEGPHCLGHLKEDHHECCDLESDNYGCPRSASLRQHMSNNEIHLSLYLTPPPCPSCPTPPPTTSIPTTPPTDNSLLLEHWTITSYQQKSTSQQDNNPPLSILHNVRSYLHFSQLAAWLSLSKGAWPKGVEWRVCGGDDDQYDKHEFPIVVISNGQLNEVVKVTASSLPRLQTRPKLACGCGQRMALKDPLRMIRDHVEGPVTSSDKPRLQSLHLTIPNKSPSSSGLPLSSSPAPLRKVGGRFDFDEEMENSRRRRRRRSYSVTTRFSDLSPHSTHLLAPFEESILRGRILPVSTVEGFKVEIGASGCGSSCPPHQHYDVKTFFYSFYEGGGSPYLGVVKINGFRLPGDGGKSSRGVVQVTLSNPNSTTVKMFIIPHTLSSLPPSSKTFIRQRTYFMRPNSSPSPKDLRYLIHLNFERDEEDEGVWLRGEVKMVVVRRSDVDAGRELAGSGGGFEEISFTVQGPVERI